MKQHLFGTEVIESNLPNVKCAPAGHEDRPSHLVLARKGLRKAPEMRAILCEWFEQVFESFDMIRISNRTSAHCCVTATELLWHISSERKQSVCLSWYQRYERNDGTDLFIWICLWMPPSIFLEGTKLVDLVFEGSCQIAILQDQSNPQQTWSNMIRLNQMQDPAKKIQRPAAKRGLTTNNTLAVASISNIQNQIFSKCAKSGKCYLPSGIYSRKIYSCLSWTSCPR